MTWRIVAASCAVVLLSLAGTSRAAKPSVDDLLFELQLVPLNGRPAPAFRLERLADGKAVALADVRGGPALLYFWASW